MATEVFVRIGRSESNYAACVEGLDGFVCAADSFEELKKEAKDGFEFHIEGLGEDVDPFPEVFNSVYSLVYR
jgi:predicted RNase H-like HicB family nuclease